MDIFMNILSRVFNYYTLTLIACLLFCVSFERRKYFWVRLGVATVAGYGLILLGEQLPSIVLFEHNFSVRFLLAYLICSAVLVVCFKLNWKETIFCIVAGCLLQHATSQVYMFSSGFLGQAGIYFNRKLLELGLSIVFYPLAYFVFARRIKTEALPFINKGKLVIVALVMMLIVYFSSYVAHSFIRMSDNLVAYVFVNLYDLLICLLCLGVQFNIFTEAKLKEDNSVLEELLVRQEKQQRLSRENIEMINIKCHDLKKQIEVIRQMGEGNVAERDELLNNLQNEVMIYDHVAKTGNDALDIVLTEKAMYCEKKNIRFSYIVDSDKLSFLKAADVYSLFGNALDNAIEYLEKQPEDKRVVALNIVAHGKILSINLINYCEDKILIKDGLPVSSKDDKTSHGFGLKSIRYIVEKYGGGLNISTENGYFNVSIAMPIPSV